MLFPVTPMTTPTELIQAAANIFSDKIIPEESMLLESFEKLGLERPLRKYEPIRDIMNSWDLDTQNWLTLVRSDSKGQDLELDVADVGFEQPRDTVIFMYYSNRPGKWSKRFISLNSDGQVVCTKKDPAPSKGPADKDVTNICHISDFDIYTPTSRQMSKVIKPPKKQCFAVKSQQKSAMFLDTSTFVHFFATDNKRDAAEWHRAVHGWRSWYLVNTMGEGSGEKARPKTAAEAKNRSAPRPLRLDSLDSGEDTPYQIGAFQPLLSMEEMEMAMVAPPTPSFPHHDRNHSQQTSPPRVDRSGTVHRSGTQRRAREAEGPPVSFPKSLQRDQGRPSTESGRPRKESQSAGRGGRPSMDQSRDPAFNPQGLLGRTYSQRQKIMEEKHIKETHENPFTGGLLGSATSTPPAPATSGGGLGRSISVRSTTNRNVNRNSRSGDGPKPFLDFVEPASLESHQIPAQHRTPKGRGFIPDHVGAGGLVENARAAGDPLNRDDRPSSGDSGSHPTADDGAFVSHGMLARSRPSQGGHRGGRGVMNGAHAKGPMVDLNLTSNFAKGSLLEKVETQQPSGIIVDRAKRPEGTEMPNGEHFSR
jgi:PH domain